MPLHPLVKQAADSLGEEERALANLEVQDDEVPAGSYEIAIYEWRFHGINEDLKLKPISSSEAVTPHLARLLEKAVDASTVDHVDYGSPGWKALDGQHYSRWTEARARHQQRMQELIAFRKESLSTSHRARLALLEEQLEKVGDERLQRMRRSQIAAADADYARRIEELESAMEQVDIVAERVVYGVLDIEEIQDGRL